MIRMDRHRSVLTLATTIALVATTGSLYFSEVLGLVPCDLCWIQRILMYPLVIVFGVAAIENRIGVWKTALPLSGLGILASTYHVYLQFQPAASCSIGGGCTSIQYQTAGGVLTIPRLALIAFVLVTGLSLALALVDRQR